MLAELEQRLQPGPAVTIAATLLLYCRERERDLIAARSASFARFPSLRETAKQCFEGIDRLEVDVEDHPLVVACLRVLYVNALALLVNIESQAVVIAARALAEGLDAALGRRIVSHFRNKKTSLGPTDAFPVIQPSLKELLHGARLSTNPAAVETGIDTLSSIRLRGTVAGWLEVEVDGTAVDALARLDRSTVLGVAWPTITLDELTWNTDAASRTFHRVRPKDCAQHVRRTKELLAHLVASGCRVAVLPELTLDPDGVEEIATWYRSEGAPLDLLVVGSAHDVEHERARNRSRALLASSAELVHDKFRPVEMVLPGNVTPLQEAIDTSCPRLRVLVTATTTLAIVICKDLLDPEALDLLVRLRLGILLVPACSPETQAFGVAVQRLAHDSQTLVLVANHTDELSQAAALFGRPLRSALVKVTARTAIAPPSHATFQLGA